MNIKREICIEELSELLEMEIWCIGCNGFRIIKDFECRQEFNVEDLHVDTEDDIIIFYNSDGSILGKFILAIFKEYLISIHHCKINGRMLEDIAFSYGHMYIESIAA